MVVLLLAAALPGIFVDAPPTAAAELKQAGISCVHVAPESVEAWKSALGCAEPFAAGKLPKVPPPGVQYRMNAASATNAPWVNTNGAKYVREPKGYVEAPEGRAALALAEAHAFGVEAVVKVAPKDYAEAGAMLKFLGGIPAAKLEPLANIGFLDDGSADAAEDMNLLIRRNLLFRIVKSPDARLDVNVKPEAGDPSQYAYTVRQKLGDAKRLLRVYGSEVLITRLAGDGTRRRLTILNYGARPAEGIRVRVLGQFPNVKVYAPSEKAIVNEVTTDASATEFSLPYVPAYMVIDLNK